MLGATGRPMQLFVWNDSGTTLPNNMNWTHCASITDLQPEVSQLGQLPASKTPPANAA